MIELTTEEQEYSLSLFNKIVYSLLAAGILCFVVYMATAVHFKHPVDAWIVLPLITIFPILLLAGLRRKVIIRNNSITSVSLFTTKEISIDAVKGCRIMRKSIMLEPLSTEHSRIEIGNYSLLSNSDQLLNWVKANFKDLNAADLETAQQQLLQDEALGDTAQSRERLLDNAKKIVPVYNTLASVVAFICIIIHGMVGNVLLLLLPLAGVLLLFTHRGLIKFYSQSNRSIYPALFLGITFSSVFALVHAVFNYDLLEWPPLLLPAFAISGIMGWLLYKKGMNPTAGAIKAQIVLIVLISLAYGFASTRLLNCAFDSSKTTAYHAIVQERFISTSKSTEHYYFVLSPWGPKHSSAQVEVGRLVYRVKYPGDTVTVQLKQGLLQMPWYWVEK
jgi:hypothetical protein